MGIPVEKWCLVLSIYMALLCSTLASLAVPYCVLVVEAEADTGDGLGQWQHDADRKSRRRREEGDERVICTDTKAGTLGNERTNERQKRQPSVSGEGSMSQPTRPMRPT
jgi:hypothetical protein